MTFESGLIDYHPGLDDPWLILSYLLLAVVAAFVTPLANRSRSKLIISGLVLVASSPFVLSAMLHGVYLIVDRQTERILCTHWVRGGALPEIAVILGIGVGLMFTPRTGWARRRHA